MSRDALCKPSGHIIASLEPVNQGCALVGVKNLGFLRLKGVESYL